MGRRRTHELYRAFSRWCFDRHGYSATTRYQYYLSTLRADGWLLEHRGTSLPFADAEDLRAFMFHLPESATTRNGVRRALIAAFEFFIDRGLVKRNIAKDIPRLRERRPLPKAVSEDIADKLLVAADSLEPIARVAVWMLMGTGLRRSALISLEWRNVEVDRIVVMEKGRREHSVPVHVELRPVIAAWKQRCPSMKWVFPSPLNPDRHVSHTWLATRVRDVGEMIGLPGLHPHVMRHTLATLVLDKTGNIRLVQELLGHVDISSTQIYTKVVHNDVADGLNKVPLGRKPSPPEDDPD